MKERLRLWFNDRSVFTKIAIVLFGCVLSYRAAHWCSEWANMVIVQNQERHMLIATCAGLCSFICFIVRHIAMITAALAVGFAFYETAFRLRRLYRLRTKRRSIIKRKKSLAPS